MERMTTMKDYRKYKISIFLMCYFRSDFHMHEGAGGVTSHGQCWIFM